MLPRYGYYGFEKVTYGFNSILLNFCSAGIGVVLVSLLLTLNIFHTVSISIVNFEHVTTYANHIELTVLTNLYSESVALTILLML